MKLRTILAFLLTIGLLYFIFSQINLVEFAQYFYRINLLWFGVFLFLLLPQIFVITKRLQLLASKETSLPFMTALKISMSGGALNLVLPSKGGDFAKAAFFKKLKLMNLTEAIGLVIFEKATDLFIICVFTVIGILAMNYLAYAFGLPIMLFALGVIGACAFIFFVDIKFIFKKKGGRIRNLVRNMYAFFLKIRGDKRLLGGIMLFAVLSWVTQFAQFWFLFMAFGKVMNPFLIFALIPTALLISMIPVTISGWGLREGAMAVLFVPFAPVELILGVSILSSLRYYCPGLFALPFVYNLSK